MNCDGETGAYKIAGVVILYNPEENVYANIMTYIDSLDILYIVDNSEDEKINIIEKIKKSPTLNILNMRTIWGYLKH